MCASPLLGTSALPTSVTIAGRAYPIRHDFRDGIRFEELMYDQRVPDGAKVALALEVWFTTAPPEDLGLVLAAMMDFYRCGKPDPQGADATAQLYSYTYDYDLIYAAFLQQYGIDLLAPATALHWWQFRAMFLGLEQTTRFMEVVGYRSMSIPDGASREYRAHVRKMKRVFALPSTDSSRPVALRDDAEYRAALEAVLAAKREGLPGA